MMSFLLHGSWWVPQKGENPMVKPTECPLSPNVELRLAKILDNALEMPEELHSKHRKVEKWKCSWCHTEPCLGNRAKGTKSALSSRWRTFSSVNRYPVVSMRKRTDSTLLWMCYTNVSSHSKSRLDLYLEAWRSLHSTWSVVIVWWKGSEK